MADTKISALTAASAAAAANELAINEAGTSKKVTAAQLKTLITTAPVFAAGTASANTAPKLTSGTLNTTAEAGALEYDGKAFYASPLASARGLSPSQMFSIVPAGDFALGTGAALQSAFPTTGDVWTLAASTSYFLEGLYYISKTGTSTVVSMGFAAAGGLTITSMLYYAIGGNFTINATNSTTGSTLGNQLAEVTVVPAGGADAWIRFNGIIRVNAGGTLTPQIAFPTAAPTSPLMKVNSWISLAPFGTNTATLLGNVG